ncbi:DoxX family protein [Nocardia arizonensis]|uniref:DoxX family protein n=1 Tax=Nocardia arizonensis TaxID=1141647 RepID=UPI0006D1AEAA|nr:DoxX family protein [Nocardia arizonensis]
MTTASKVLGGVFAAEFLSLGAAEVAAMRERAAHLGYSTAAYRGIGAGEILAAGGVLLGSVRPVIGRTAGAAACHLRNGDGATEIAPATGAALVTAAYVAMSTSESR